MKYFKIKWVKKMSSIPKIIHYCWFGRNPLPESAVKCINSWRRFFPDYEIKEWNEDNFDVNCCDYVREAYKSRKYAFVSDYARFDILYREGGLYFDVDVEVINSFDDILEKGGFMGSETIVKLPERGISVAPGLGLSSIPGHSIIKELVDGYHVRHFLKEDGTPDTTTICVYTTEILKKHGLQETNYIQCIDGIYVYPKDFFCPLDYFSGKLEITENTRSIHQYMASWKSATDNRKTVIKRLLGPKLTKFVGRVLHGKQEK